VQSDVYFQLWRINRSLDHVEQALDILRRHPAFRRREIDRFRSMAHEVRAATSSYLAERIEIAETVQAGRQFAKRLARERKDDLAR
jgi:hypothetical protein